MDEAAARAWLDVPRETMQRLEQYEHLLREESERQNLVSRASLETLWSRHFVDSAQLVRFAPGEGLEWLDLGSGPGLPGLVIAMLRRSKVTLVESRRLRADFLHRAAAALQIEDRVEIASARVETLQPRPFDVITARAFAPLERLLPLAEPFSRPDTIWVLPKGRQAKSELEAVRSSWQGEFRLEQSLTDADAQIIVASQVRRIKRGKSGR